MNEHYLEGILFPLWKDVNTLYFKFKTTYVNLLSVSVDLVIWLVRSPVNQAPCKGSLVDKANKRSRTSRFWRLSKISASIQFKIICIALFTIQSLQSNFTGN